MPIAPIRRRRAAISFDDTVTLTATLSDSYINQMALVGDVTLLSSFTDTYSHGSIINEIISLDSNYGSSWAENTDLVVTASLLATFTDNYVADPDMYLLLSATFGDGESAINEMQSTLSMPITLGDSVSIDDATFFESVNQIEQGMKTATAAGMGGVLVH